MTAVSVTHGASHFEWHPDAGVVLWWHTPDCSLGLEEAESFAAIEALIPEGDECVILVDGTGIQWADLGYRAAAARLLRKRKRTLRVAVFGLPPPIVVMAKMMFTATNARATATRNRKAAEAFLGISSWRPPAGHKAT